MLLLHLLAPLLFSALFVLAFPTPWMFAQFVAGVVIGFSLFFMERLADAFFVQPDTEFNTLVRSTWQHRHYREVIKLLLQAKTLQTHLLTRSVLFMLIYVALAIFVLTSTGSVFGIGVILGIGLHFLLDLCIYRRHPAEFRLLFLWQLKQNLSDRDRDLLIAGFGLFFIIISLLVLR